MKIERISQSIPVEFGGAEYFGHVRVYHGGLLDGKLEFNTYGKIQWMTRNSLGDYSIGYEMTRFGGNGTFTQIENDINRDSFKKIGVMLVIEDFQLIYIGDDKQVMEAIKKADEEGDLRHPQSLIKDRSEFATEGFDFAFHLYHLKYMESDELDILRETLKKHPLNDVRL